MAGIAVGVLVFTGVTTVTLARRSARDAAVDDLRDQGRTVEAEIEALLAELRELERPVQQRRLRGFIAGTLRLSRASVVTVQPDGTVVDGFGSATPNPQAEVLHLPAGVSADDLDTDALLDGEQQSRLIGDTALVARPLDPIPNEGTPILVLTDDVDNNTIGRAGPFFVGAAILALLVAGLVAYWLARRLTRPLAAMQETAARIGEGDLSARVVLPRGTDEELAGLARTLDGMAAELEAGRGLERSFLLSVSHELRTPLTSIKGYAEAIADGAVVGREEQAHAAEIIVAEARRLERLVADLLDLARLDTKQFALTPRPIDARTVVAGAVEAFRPKASDLGITLELAANEAVPVDADPERLAQIVANLVENALKYARARVRVDVIRRNGSVELQVVDDGPGIDSADLPHVFERLFTSRTAPGRKLGTGLGLAIVRELVGAMGGSAAAETLDGEGARFVVRIPRETTHLTAP
jgi:two-component system sensor histidine kinase BaeS